MTTSTIKDLYDRDYHLWLEETSKLLKAKDFENIDLENLIEEIESLGRRDAIRETGITNLPQDCPYSMEQTLEHNFFPSNF
jgi:hypothetical protein